jgi:hypothetical protein
MVDCVHERDSGHEWLGSTTSSVMAYRERGDVWVILRSPNHDDKDDQPGAEPANVFEDHARPGQWRGEWLDDDGRCELEIFMAIMHDGKRCLRSSHC